MVYMYKTPRNEHTDFPKLIETITHTFQKINRNGFTKELVTLQIANIALRPRTT